MSHRNNHTKHLLGPGPYSTSLPDRLRCQEGGGLRPWGGFGALRNAGAGPLKFWRSGDEGLGFREGFFEALGVGFEALRHFGGLVASSHVTGSIPL